jgi:hypothetical protein
MNLSKRVPARPGASRTRSRLLASRARPPRPDPPAKRGSAGTRLDGLDIPWIGRKWRGARPGVVVAGVNTSSRGWSPVDNPA